MQRNLICVLNEIIVNAMIALDIRVIQPIWYFVLRSVLNLNNNTTRIVRIKDLENPQTE